MGDSKETEFTGDGSEHEAIGETWGHAFTGEQLIALQAEERRIAKALRELAKTVKTEALFDLRDRLELMWLRLEQRARRRWRSP